MRMPSPSPSPVPASHDLISVSSLLAVVGITVAFVGIIVMIVVTRRYGTRHTRLIIDTRNVRLLPISLYDSVTGKTEIIEPNPPMQYSVQIRLMNVGPDDITEESFHGIPLTFNLGALAAETAATNMASNMLDVQRRQAILKPRQIPKGCSWHWNIQCYGERPHLTISSTITNVDIKLRQHSDSAGDGGLIGGRFGFEGSQQWWKGRVWRW